ncbi:hypothetical protein JOF41_005980 [Saccharothrix coeruleofusca]|uniref:hypothetical protein n=1 Tax=Saccharothrix coeruleofusca TaxID=33919 RepID=UPI001AE4FB60|nr:hypothetical protein [Saccharothrix coeruleofusca]MBP2339802.1 hypothetical protein [Saccharothrix coeruleofusca]
MATTRKGRPTPRDPVVDDWFRDLPAGEVLLEAEQLSGLMLAVERYQPEEVSDLVMARWHRLIASHRRLADQSEPAFIDQARRQGWTWQRIADVLGLPDAEAAEQRQAFLAAELTRTHPANQPQPWIGWAGNADSTS